MEHIEVLIEKFWAGNTSEVENLLLLQLLTEHETALTGSMERTFTALVNSGVKKVKDEQSQRLLKSIHQQMTLPEAAPVLRPVSLKKNHRIWWAAASVIMLLGVATLMMLQPADKRQAGAHTREDGTGTPVLQTVTNHADTMQRLSLTDGSLVTLSPQAAVSYYEPFRAASRNISLSGKALFRVAKDTARPFTVYAKGIATTALGTIFSVDTEEPDTIRVHLLEGKVMVYSNGAGNFANKRVILAPGQQFAFNTRTSRYLVSTPPGKDNSAPVAKQAGPVTSGQPAASLLFQNAPLPAVFREVAKTYKIDIRFNEKDISGLYFSGSLMKDDSIRMVLSAICSMNGLLFTEQQGFILIKKSN